MYISDSMLQNYVVFCWIYPEPWIESGPKTRLGCHDSQPRFACSWSNPLLWNPKPCFLFSSLSLELGCFTPKCISPRLISSALSIFLFNVNVHVFIYVSVKST